MQRVPALTWWQQTTLSPLCKQCESNMDKKPCSNEHFLLVKACLQLLLSFCKFSFWAALSWSYGGRTASKLVMRRQACRQSQTIYSAHIMRSICPFGCCFKSIKQSHCRRELRFWLFIIYYTSAGWMCTVCVMKHRPKIETTRFLKTTIKRKGKTGTLQFLMVLILPFLCICCTWTDEETTVDFILNNLCYANLGNWSFFSGHKMVEQQHLRCRWRQTQVAKYSHDR